MVETQEGDDYTEEKWCLLDDVEKMKTTYLAALAEDVIQHRELDEQDEQIAALKKEAQTLHDKYGKLWDKNKQLREAIKHHFKTGYISKMKEVLRGGEEVINHYHSEGI